MNSINKAKSIGRNLSLSSEAIDQLRNELEEQKGKAPKNTEVVEARLRAIQGELDSLSEKMLAYKLQRIASSKMLAQVSELSRADQALETVKDDESPKASNPPGAAQPPRVKGKPQDTLQGKSKTKSESKSESKSQKMVMVRKKNPTDTEYASSTFQCKSDLDMCLADAAGALDRALCFTLFIRCAVKG